MTKFGVLGYGNEDVIWTFVSFVKKNSQNLNISIVKNEFRNIKRERISFLIENTDSLDKRSYVLPNHLAFQHEDTMRNSSIYASIITKSNNAYMRGVKEISRTSDYIIATFSWDQPLEAQLSNFVDIRFSSNRIDVCFTKINQISKERCFDVWQEWKHEIDTFFRKRGRTIQNFIVIDPENDARWERLNEVFIHYLVLNSNSEAFSQSSPLLEKPELNLTLETEKLFKEIQSQTLLGNLTLLKGESDLLKEKQELTKCQRIAKDPEYNVDPSIKQEIEERLKKNQDKIFNASQTIKNKLESAWEAIETYIFPLNLMENITDMVQKLFNNLELTQKFEKNSQNYKEMVTQWDKHSNVIMRVKQLEEIEKKYRELFNFFSNPMSEVIPFSIPFRFVESTKFSHKIQAEKVKANKDIQNLFRILKKADNQIKEFDIQQDWNAGMKLIQTIENDIQKLGAVYWRDRFDQLKNRLSIKQQLVDIAHKYPRIHIDECVEAINSNRQEILKIFDEMVQNKQIAGQYFMKTDFFLFDQKGIPTKFDTPFIESSSQLPETFIDSTNKSTFLRTEDVNTAIAESKEILHTQNLFIQIQEEITRGGLGIIYEGVVLPTGEKVIVKKLIGEKYIDSCGESSCEEYWTREQVIIEKQGRANNPAMHLIGAVKREYNEKREYYLILEFIDGPSLETWIHEYLGNLEHPSQKHIEELIEQIILPLCVHINSIHHIGVVHRDITPRNILIKQHHGKPYPILIDWGVAKEISQKEMYTVPKPFMTDMRTVATGIHSVGNPPEIIGGFRPVAASDIYMFGYVIYYLLTGGHYLHVPVVQSDYELHPIEENSAVPPKIDHLIKCMTKYEPADRIHSIEEVEKILVEYITSFKQ